MIGNENISFYQILPINMQIGIKYAEAQYTVKVSYAGLCFFEATHVRDKALVYILLNA